MNFNPAVHESDENKDPLRNQDGSIRLRKDWKSHAVDRQGRKFNQRVHGEEPLLDDGGYLTVRRRESKAGNQQIGRTEAVLAKYKEDGYAYYFANDEGGRHEQMIETDWERVEDQKAKRPVGLTVGMARSPNAKAFLYRKPIEWYEADQQKKREAHDIELKNTNAPKEEEGQYEADGNTPLR